MKSRRFRIILLLSACVIALLVMGSVYFGQSVAQWLIMKRALNDPERLARASLVPRDFDLTEEVNPSGLQCSIGYAEFILPTDAEPIIEPLGSGTAVGVRSKDFELVFLSPHEVQYLDPREEMVAKRILTYLSKTKITSRFHRQNFTMMDKFMLAEELIPLSLPRIARLDKQTVSYYTILLFLKSFTEWKTTDLLFFRSRHGRGIINCFEDPEDRLRVHFSFEDHERNASIGFYLNLLSGVEDDALELARMVASTFRFTVDAVPAEEQLKKLIRSACENYPEHATPPGERQLLEVLESEE